MATPLSEKARDAVGKLHEHGELERWKNGYWTYPGCAVHHREGSASYKWGGYNVPAWKQDRVNDTMTEWAGTGKTIGLDRLFKALGLPGKQGFDGSQVWDAVKDGRIAEVIAYNVADVHRLRACFRVINGLPPVQEIAA